MQTRVKKITETRVDVSSLVTTSPSPFIVRFTFKIGRQADLPTRAGCSCSEAASKVFSCHCMYHIHRPEGIGEVHHRLCSSPASLDV